MRKVVLITGCSSGVGFHTALKLSALGYKTYASMRDLSKSDKLKAAAKDLSTDLEIIQLDVQDTKSIEAAVKSVVDREGRIDALVNNAGFGFVRSLEQATESEMRDVFDVNYFGVARCVKAVMPHMRSQKSGHILAVSSVGGLVGQPMNELYCSAKFAVEGLFESMATYAEPYFKIKMTLIEPAGIKTEFVGRVMADMKATGGVREDAYAPILKDYFETSAKRGSFETNAQTPEQVADVIVDALQNPKGELRIQTSPIAKAFCAEKLAQDPTGVQLQTRIRSQLLGINKT
ncbi:MAG: SDR family oxidoreductase [Proteobacteria bacterium]|nr:MAG: SDR family oxidoreductase [Pseudomonadota bacterium]